MLKLVLKLSRLFLLVSKVLSLQNEGLVSFQSCLPIDSCGRIEHLVLLNTKFITLEDGLIGS